MTNTKGFALTVTLLFLLLMTLFGFSVLMLADSYYSSTRNFFEKENARIACNQAIHLMIDRHNLDPAPQRFFTDPEIWQGITMTPFVWNDHEIGAFLAKPWSATEPNQLTAVARKGRYSASRLVQNRQRRFEDFAEMCRWQQTSPESAFTRKRLCSLATPTGRITLRDARLIITENGQRTEQPVEDETAWNHTLQTYFGISQKGVSNATTL